MQKLKTSFEELRQKYLSRIEHLARRPNKVSADTACAARVILLLGEGHSFKEAAVLCELSPSRVETIRRRFMVHGIGGLFIPVRTSNTVAGLRSRLEEVPYAIPVETGAFQEGLAA